MKRLVSAAFAAWLLLLAGAPAFATGWPGLLRNTPAEVYDDEDLRLFLEAARKTLNAEGPPEEIAWQNPATESAGRFLEIGRSATPDGRACKRVRMWMSAKRRAEKTSVMSACRDAEGRWRIGTPQSAPR